MRQLEYGKLHLNQVDEKTTVLVYRFKSSDGNMRACETSMFDMENRPDLLAKTLREFATFINKNAR